MNAVVLAGGVNRGPLQEMTGIDNKALIRLGDTTMAQHVVDALRGSRLVDSILLVGPPDAASGLDAVVPERANVLENINAGFSFFGGDDRLLFVTADIPLLTPQAVDDFLGRAVAENADIVYPVVRKDVIQARFPKGERTYVRLRSGAVTGGNIMLLRGAFMRSRQVLAQEIFALRKNPVQLARRLGFLLLVRLVLGKVDLPDIERAAARLTGGRARALVSGFPEIAFDVDKPGDLETVSVAIAWKGTANIDKSYIDR